MLAMKFCVLLIAGVAIANGKKPTVTDTSKDVTKYEGSTASFVCNFADATTSDVLWYKNDKPVTTSSRVFTTDISANSQMLTINSIITSDASNYSCIVTNPDGSARRDMALKIIPKSTPIINSIPDLYLRLGQMYAVECSVESFPEAIISWFKNNGFSDDGDNDDSILTIKNMTAGDVGTYRCKAVNEIGTAEMSFKIILAEGTKWVQKPATQSVNVSQSFVWTASIVSVEKRPRIVWYKDGNVIAESLYVQTSYGAVFTSSLTLASVNIGDAGEYQVNVNNVAVSGITQDMQLTVWASPIVEIDEGTELLAEEGDAVTLTCIVQAYPNATIMWTRNNSHPIPAISKKQLIKEKSRSIHTLTLEGVTEDDSGFYMCTSENNLGTGVDFISLKVTSEDDGGSSKSQITIVLVVSGIVILLIIVVVFLYIKYRETLFGPKHLAPNGQFYTDLVSEEKEAHCLADIENNPNTIKKNINISIKMAERSGSLSTKKFFTEKNNAKKFSLKNTLMKKEPTVAENHYARLGSVVGQGKAIDFKHITFDEILGSGEYGHITGGRIIDDQDASAYKDISIKMLYDDSSAQSKRDMLTELRMMRRVSRHPNVVSFVGWCITDDNVYILEELPPFGNLLTFLRVQRLLSQSRETLEDLPEEDRVDEKSLLSFAWQIASGMKHLANLQIVHRDLACRNVYLGHEKVCKISDYGVCRDIYTENVYRKTTGGQLPVRWMAYEAVFQGTYTQKSDVWSFGILLWELISVGKIPYSNTMRTEQLLDELEAGSHMENPGHISTDLYLLMNLCWNRSPENRPTFSDLVRELGDIMQDTDEVHIDLSKLFNSELQDALSGEDDVVSPTTDFHRREPFVNTEREPNIGETPDAILPVNT